MAQLAAVDELRTGVRGEVLLRAAYGSSYERLQALQAGYDLGNLFRHALSATAPPEPGSAR